ncbi:MAG: hypothetical protein CMN06_10555 [Roseibacillus sp.]|nr:hypothetical protein [Roseibacillus sp.]
MAFRGGDTFRMQPLKALLLCFPFVMGVGDLVIGDDRADESWWSLQPIPRPEVPTVENAGWVRNPIDAFILAKLEEKGLQPTPEASEGIIGRRLHFGLTGLPPEPGVTTDVDALLASPHYGERWARHWLDVARYGESNGFEYDQLRPNAWTYRDWVIDAFNEDMPYDQFVKWQIAGDVLEPDHPGAIAATGFLVCGAFDGLKPSGDKQRRIMREDEMEDIVGTVSQSFLGLTVHCARCHDHKFDPIAQKEYFQMASALAGVHRGDRNVPAGLGVAEKRKKIEELSRKLADSDGVVRKRLLARMESDGSRKDRDGLPQPVSRWSFDKDLRDEIGSLHGEAKGTARVEGGALVLDGKTGFVLTAPLTKTIKSRTLEAWVQLSSLDQKGGGVLGLQGLSGEPFDAIVYGEKESRRWMSGSSGHRRTSSFGGAEEKDAKSQFVHLAIVYHEDGTIIGYRNGRPYGKSYKTGFMAYGAGEHQVILGMRHGTSSDSKRMLAGRIDRAQLYDRALTAEQVALSADVKIVTEDALIAALSDEQKVTRKAWKSEIARLNAEVSKQGQKKVYAVTPRGAPVRHLLVRGSPFEKGEEVAAGGVASVRNGLSSQFGLKSNAPEGERRRKLAEWVAHHDNPLLARVMVNRIWHYHFGQGLVKTPNDLGFSGGKPSHPKLLDWLAAEFRSRKWSVKAMHKLIVSSATYRQGSRANPEAQAIDAGNVYLWRRAPMRLEAESIRDSILAVSGALNPLAGGPGYRDFKMYNHKGSWVYDPIDPEGPEFNRRSIYRTWARGNVHPLLSPLDCPDPSAAAPVRSVTTTPLGALSLMNTSFVIRMSEEMAKRLATMPGGEERQVGHAIELAFGRPATARDINLGLGFVQENGLAAYCRVLFNANEFLYLN